MPPHALRRSWPVLGSVLVALALAAGCAGTSGPQPRGHQAPPLRATADLLDPAQVVSRNGVLRTSIAVERKKVRLAGSDVWALTYNGLYMPPTLRLKPGDRMEIAFENKLDQETNLHVHGMHVSPGEAADNVFLSVGPGETFAYRYAFPKDLRPGTYWYHPHAHSLSTAQVAGGMAGLVVVDGLDAHLPEPLRGITERTVALKDFQIDGDAVKTAGLTMNAETTRTVNGQVNPRIRIRPGETQLWRIANIGANIFYKVALPGSVFHVVAQDGYPVKEVYGAESLVIPAGSRYDVLVQGGPAGTTELQTLPYDSGRTGGQFPQATLATVESAGEPVEPAELPTAFAPVEDLGQETPADSKTITFTENRDNTLFYVNGKQFDHNRVDFRVKLNTVEEWTIRNNSQEDHSFHVHTNSFQVMSVNGQPQPANGLRDTVLVPARGNIVVRTRFLDYPGKTVLHCHILNHEDRGMMAVLQIDE
ncbi:multicopper oxidase family protein [Streptomyces sp. cmx-4-9]|uniref:multicopper oxidase family protein n=1 Tax=Streptomyces sp. cmx-4-9 TaxID=2790941 RepID=UPI003980E57D